MNLTDFKFISKREAAQIMGISVSTLNRRRKDLDEWKENIHYTRRDSGEYEYNEALMLAWHNRAIYPHAYVNALQAFQQAVESSQKRKKQSA